MVPIRRQREEKREGRGSRESGAMRWQRPWRIGKSETTTLELGVGERKGGFGFKIRSRVLLCDCLVLVIQLMLFSFL